MKKMMLAAVILAGAAASARATVYEIDPTHSLVGFKVAHLVVSKVTGRFAKFAGTMDYDQAAPKTWSARARIETASVDTGVEARDKHLRSADFFDVDKFPAIEFKSVRAEAKNGKTTLIGDLTLHGVTKRVALDLVIGGTVKDPWGGERLGATATTKINRKDYGLTWNKTLESGGLAVGDEIEITLEMEGVAKKS